MNTTSSPSVVVPFCFDDHLIRTVTIESEPWFVAKDVCEVLDLKWQGSKSIEFLEDEEKMVGNFPTTKGNQDTLIISESGLYTLIIRSNKPQAKPFRKWVTAEVLPQIRRNGHYSYPDSGDFFTPTTYGTSTISIARLEEAARGIKAAMIMARAYGLKNEQARIYANRLVKDITGIDTLALLNAAEIETRTTTSISDYRHEIDEIVGQYIAERCNLDVPGRVSSTVLYTDFCDWHRKRHTGEIPDRKFFGRNMARCRPRLKSVGNVYYTGIALRPMEVTA